MKTNEIMANTYPWSCGNFYLLRTSLLAGLELCITLSVLVLQNGIIQVAGQDASDYWGDSYCTYDGRILQPGDVLQLDQCTSCRCDESIYCSIQSCRPYFCSNPVTLDDKCCEVCPYYIPVYEVIPENLRIVRGWEYLTYHLEMDLKLSINHEGQSVHGDRLWRVGMWAGANEDGSGTRVGEVRQVLNEEQDSLRIDRPILFGAYNFTFLDVRYPLDVLSKEDCQNISYICVEFSKGDHAKQLKIKVPFIVVGVKGAENATEVPSNLITCLPYPLCEASDDYEGIWSTTSATVIEIEGVCYPPAVPANGYVVPEDYYYNYGQLVSIHCQDGFQLVDGARTLVCTDTGDWFGNIPKCVLDIATTQETTTLPLPTNALPAFPIEVIQNGTALSNHTAAAEANSIKIHKLNAVMGKTVNYIRVDLQVPVRARATHEDGPVRVETWASDNPTGHGDRIGYSEQSNANPIGICCEDNGQKNSDEIILNLESVMDMMERGELLRPGHDLALKNLTDRAGLSTTDLVIPDFNLTLDISNTTCDGIKYLCASFGLKYLSTPNLTSIVSANDDNSSHSDKAIIGCQPFSVCEDEDEDRPGCVYYGQFLSRGDVFDINSCTSCLCTNDSTISCDIKTCPEPHCEVPIELEELCCRICPYLDLLDVGSVEVGTVTNMSITLQVWLHEQVMEARGTQLWKLSVWADNVNDGTGSRLAYTDQVLNEEQASKNLRWSQKLGARKFLIDDVKISLDTNNSSCKELKYLCATFNMGDNPNPRRVKYGTIGIPFNVSGVQSANDSTPNPSRLVGCQPFTTCIETHTTIEPPTTPMPTRGCFAPFGHTKTITTTPQKFLYNYGHEVKIECANGYELVGNHILRCSENGTWIGEKPGLPQCWYKADPTDKPVEVCARPQLANESVIIPDKEVYSLGEQVEINCSDGLTLVGNHSLLCRSNETWDGELPLCIFEGCLRPNIGNEHNIIIPDQKWYSYGQVVNLQINCTDDMTKLHGDEILVCTDNRTWFGEVPHCLPLPTRITTPAPTTDTYGKGCPRPIIPNDGGILPDEDWYHCGQKVMVKCKDDYYLVGDEILICSDIGIWYKNFPKCLRKVKLGAPEPEKCQRPKTPSDGTLSPGEMVFFPGQTIHLNCKAGYRLIGEEFIVCSSSGKWHGTIGRCQYVPPKPSGCSRPTVSFGAMMTPSKNRYDHGEKVKFNCTEGYRLVGDKVLVCDDTGSWHKPYPICETKDNVLTPAVLSLCAAGVLLLGVLIFLNCVSEGYKPTAPPKLIHRVRRRNALNKMLPNNNNHTRTRPPGHAEKCNGIA